jgi:integrase/recombinase XerD
MSLIAPTLQRFFGERLMRQRQASPHTIAAYRDAIRLLLGYTERTTRKSPCQLDWEDLDSTRIGAFLDYLEQERGVSVATRNARLAALRSLFKFAALHHPEHAALIQRVLAIPSKRSDRSLVVFLTREEMEALLRGPDRTTRTGRRDHTLLMLAVQTGLRVSELTSLRRSDLELGTGANVHCVGKGRKERRTPLTRPTVAILRAWLAERGGGPSDAVFPGPGGGPLGRHAIYQMVFRHVATAAAECPSLASKHVSPHVLRHTNAMQLRQAGLDLSSIALWLGHESPRTTQVYLHADLAEKQRTISKVTPLASGGGRYQPDDSLLAYLDAL